MSRRAFSMVELLVAVGIIAVLAALLIPVIGLIRNAAKRMVTAQRMQTVVDGLLVLGQQGGAADAIMRRCLTGPDISDTGVVSTTATVNEAYDFKPLRHVVELVGRGRTNASLTGTTPLPNTKVTITRGGNFTFAASEWNWIVDAGSPSGLTNYNAFDPLDPSVSLIGETWKETSELAPAAGSQPTAAWFRGRWPRSWPTSDWDQASPGLVPPRWGSPWGRPPIDPATGNPSGAVEARNLGQLSPLYSVALLQASGVLPEGSEGISAYRVDRSPGKPWNDLWGRPLVAAAGIFLPNRSEYLDGRNYSGRQPYAGLSAAIVNQARTLAFGRPRDATLNAAQQAYGFNRAVYLAIGAPGPALSPDAEAALAGTWDDNTERTLLRAIWLQVRDTCAASEWDERGFASPPWSGVRSRRSNGLRSQLSAPLEIK